MWYNQLVETLFFETRHSGKLEGAWVAQFETVHEDAAGNRILVALGVNSKGKIGQARYLVRGEPLVVATLELLCQRAEGCCIQKLTPVDYRSLVDELEAPALRYPAVVLAASVFNRAVAGLQAQEKC